MIIYLVLIFHYHQAKYNNAKALRDYVSSLSLSLSLLRVYVIKISFLLLL